MIDVALIKSYFVDAFGPDVFLVQSKTEVGSNQPFDWLTFANEACEFTILIDKRMDGVSSYIVFQYDLGRLSDKIYTSVAREIIDADSSCKKSKDIFDSRCEVQNKIRSEIANMQNIISYIEKNDISRQALEFFYFGYNCGAMKPVETNS